MTEPNEPPKELFMYQDLNTGAGHFSTSPVKDSAAYKFLSHWVEHEAYQALQSELEKVKAELEQLKDRNEEEMWTIAKANTARQYAETELAAEKAKSEKLIDQIYKVQCTGPNQKEVLKDLYKLADAYKGDEK